MDGEDNKKAKKEEQNNISSEFNQKWSKRMRRIGMHILNKQDKKEMLKELKKLESDAQREKFLKQLYNSPQASFERFAFWFWILIIVVILLVVFL
jgi:uncharacterized protein with von Willebrand factor type A (vWA) domain